MALQNCSIWDMKTYLGNTYHIPDYQREYSWEAAELSDFWDDLESTKNDSDGTTHFFGQMVIHKDKTDKYIIDGQQRTVTSVIFLRALQLFYEDIFLKTKSADADEKRTDITSLCLGRYTSKANKLHLILNEPDRDYFRTAIQLGEPNYEAKAKKKSHERMRKAFIFFFDHIKSSLADYSEADVDGKIDCLDQYYDAFLFRFNVLYMEATKLEEAFVIFETLNACGKDLETSDLLKNYIFSQSKDIALAQTKWTSMINILDKADPTKYIRHFWNSSENFTRDKELYRAISKHIATPKSSKAFLNSLEKYAPIYHAMAYPGEDTPFQSKKLIQSLRALKILKARSFYPVVLAMEQSDRQFTEDDLAYVVGTIEAYMLRNFAICGKVANQSERFFAATAKSIYDGTLDDVETICDKVKEQMVSDEEFEGSFSTWTASNSQKELVRYILSRIHRLLDRNLELNPDTSEVHIEHIMPVDCTQWTVDPAIHDDYLWRLGNLALLSGPLNQSISNKPFAEKKAGYAASKIEPNSRLSLYSEWGASEITNRQKELAKYALKIWKK